MEPSSGSEGSTSPSSSSSSSSGNVSKKEKKSKGLVQRNDETTREFNQRRVMMGWVNHVLSSVGVDPVVDLVEEFRDGVVMGAFVEALVGVRVKVFFSFSFFSFSFSFSFSFFFFFFFFFFSLFSSPFFFVNRLTRIQRTKSKQLGTSTQVFVHFMQEDC